MAHADSAMVARMEKLLVQVQTTQKMVQNKEGEIAKLQQTAFARSNRAARSNPALAKLQEDIQMQQHMLRTMEDKVHKKQAEHESARRHEEEVTHRIEAWKLEDRDEDLQVEEMRRSNRELQNKFRHVEKEKFLRDQELQKMRVRLNDVEQRGRQMQQVAEDNRNTLMKMGYEVDNLDKLQSQADNLEADLVTIEQISDMMDEAMSMMDSALETARLEQDIVNQAGDKAAEAQHVASQEFERSPQMRLWMASGMAACAVYKAMTIGKMRGKKYVSDAQIRQAQTDIIDRLAESEVVKARLADRLYELQQREAVQRENLIQVEREQTSKRVEVEELQAALDDPETNLIPALRQSIPDEESRRRMATNQLREIELEWQHVDAAAKEKFKAAEQAIRDHLGVLEWERAEARLVRERVASMQERQLQVVEQRLRTEEQQLEQENDDEVPEDLRRLM